MASLDNLPNEIIGIILNHLPQQISSDGVKQEVPPITALRRTSRRFFHLADPRVHCSIYERYAFKITRPSELAHWARKVARNPECARFIKEIHLAHWPPREYPNVAEKVGLPTQEQFAAAVKLANLSSDLHETLLRLIALNSDAAHLAFLLTACRDIETVTIRATLDDLGPLLQRVILQCSCRPTQPSLDSPQVQVPRFHRFLSSTIRRVELGSEWSISSLDAVLPLLCMPRLHTLTVLRLGDSQKDTQSYSVPDLTPRCTQPIDLVFEDCFLSGTGLARILASCTRPRSLRARWLSSYKDAFIRRDGAGRCASQMLESTEHLINVSVGDAVREHGTSLEHLHLDTTDLYPGKTQIGVPSFGSFKSLPKLRTLRVPQSAFPHVYNEHVSWMLPPSLQTICILGYRKGEIPFEEEAFDRFFAEAKTSSPNFKRMYRLPWRHPIEVAKQTSGSCVAYPLQDPQLTIGGELAAWDWSWKGDASSELRQKLPPTRPIWLQSSPWTAMVLGMT